ncbi:MAG: erythromycin esterase family protein [Myxococcales bacterium]|nr:erythromycin esterase family protein [Myxococcales bacterium]
MRTGVSVMVWAAVAGPLACAPKLRAGEVAEVRASLDEGRAGGGGIDLAVGRVLGLGAPIAGAQTPGLSLELLVTEHGFSGLALDVDATAARALDAFVNGAEVDVDAALTGLGEPGLASREMRTLLLWMRAYNLQQPFYPQGQPHPMAPGYVPSANEGAVVRRVRVFGLDPRDGDAAAAVVLAYFDRVDPAYVATARSLLAGGVQLGVEAVLQRLDDRREAYAKGDAAAWVDARQQAEVTAQARRMAETWEFEAREFARARNAEWALAQLDGGKLLVMADNRQVAAEVPGAAPSMGNFIKQWLGADYRAFGAIYTGGQVRGEGCSVTLIEVEEGSFEAALAGLNGGWIDLRGRTGLWVRPQRIGGETLRPALAFDGLWVVPQVEPATPLDPRCGAHEAASRDATKP